MFILRILPEYGERGKKIVYVLLMAFYMVPRKGLKFAMRMNGIPEILVTSVMNLYDTATTRL